MRLFFLRFHAFKNAIFSFRVQSSKPLLGLSFSMFLWGHHYFSFSKQLQLQPISSMRDIVFLSKQDYFDKILGNESEFFFLVVYAENEEGINNVNKVATKLRNLAEENGLEDWNVYVLSRSIFDDIKKTIGRTRNMSLFDNSLEATSIELFLKTPHSRNFLYMKYKQNKFLTSQNLKKLSNIMNKARQLTRIVTTEEEFRDHLAESLNKFNKPTIILRVEDSNKATFKKIVKKFSKLAFLTLERKLLPFDTNFIIIKGNNLSKNINLEADCPYIFRNDAIQAYERYSGNKIENNENNVIIDDVGGCQQKVYLEKFDNSELKVFRREKIKEREDIRKAIKEKETSAFFNFVLPRITVIKNLNYREFGQLMKKCSQEKKNDNSIGYKDNKLRIEENNEFEQKIEQTNDDLSNHKPKFGKYILSLYCSSTDTFKDKKLAIFMELYKKYRKLFIFCIVESNIVQDFFPHGKDIYPCFTLFNFLNQKKDYGVFNHYYKTLVYPYEKYFLNPKSLDEPNREEVLDSVELFLGKKLKTNYINTLEENIQELKGNMSLDAFNELKKQSQDGLFVLVGEENVNKQFTSYINKLSEEFPKVKFFKMNGLNETLLFLKFENLPQLVYISNRKKKIYFLNEDLAIKENNLEGLLKILRG